MEKPQNSENTKKSKECNSPLCKGSWFASKLEMPDMSQKPVTVDANYIACSACPSYKLKYEICMQKW